MRGLPVCTLLVVGASLAAAMPVAAGPLARGPAATRLVATGPAATGPVATASRPSEADLQGDWEAVIASPKRPWNLMVHFRRAGAAWVGTLGADGWPEFPLQGIRVDSTRVQFRLPAELDSLAFDGTLDTDEIVGSIAELDGGTPTRLTRVRPLPAPQSRVEAWQQDIDFAIERVCAYDRSFSPRARDAFRQALARLRRDLPRMQDDQILVALSRAVALGQNAHTWLRLDPTALGAFATELPIRFWWFSDGPYVIRAAPAYRRTLRCRVVAIDGHEVSAAREQVASLFAGNAPWHAYLSPLFLTSPDILHGLGLIGSPEGATFTFENAPGSRFDLWINAEPIDPTTKPAESWQELSPRQVTGQPPWATAIADRREGLPLYLQHPEQPYWFEFQPGSGLLYFQYNRSHDSEQGPTFKMFGDSLLAFAEQHAVRSLVIDLRLNSGGDLDVARDFMPGLSRLAKVDQPGRLFVIIGNTTFSAGLFHAAQLKQFTPATFVGQPAGDELDFWAEGGKIVLPNSRAAIWYSNGFHRYSGAEYPDHRPYYEELKIPDLKPDIPAPLSSQDYFAGRDPALEAIAERRRD